MRIFILIGILLVPSFLLSNDFENNQELIAQQQAIADDHAQDYYRQQEQADRQAEDDREYQREAAERADENAQMQAIEQRDRYDRQHGGY